MTEDGDRVRSRSLEGTILGRYRLVRWLGEGGMGAVYEAIHQDLGKRAAIKTLHERFAASPDARQRFLREGKAAAQIRHSNVADVYDVVIDSIHPYLVMELLDGEDLSRLISRQKQLPVQQSADLLVPVVAAVAAAHDLGIVHRDLKPENIFLTPARTGLTPKVLDFGISKLADSEDHSALTGTGALLGTPHYMSPEQARGDRQVDARSDQYSLGVILYQCVTGRRPLQGVPLYSLIQKTVHGDFPPPRQLHPGLPSAFEALILQAMARQPERRFPTTRALGQALLAFASDGVQSAYGTELGGLLPEPLAPARQREVHDVELSTTLGESAHVRAVAETKPLRRRLGTISAVVVAAGLLFAWRLAQQRPAREPAGAVVVTADEPGAVTPAPSADVTAALPRHAGNSVAPLPSGAAALEAEAERELAQGQLAGAVNTFRRAYALGLDPRSLQQGARAQTELWRSTRRPEECQKARELWLGHLAVVTDPEARAASKATLAELGECGEPAAPARPARPKANSATARTAPAAAPVPPEPAAAPLPSADTVAKKPRGALPSDDPNDGFVDIESTTRDRGAAQRR